ncbi:MAG: DoxX family protein [Flavobacteriaceae bacterium]|nr:DoxX family protein [Flavobacteriaceae bacterium]MCY4217627.1 DoxX family protein [Flavobacteriaceae bacterium]MCY4253685.1 DoxX family protein [Flavobacteriaceae bacterium]
MKLPHWLYILRVAIAAILIQSLYFKFTAHPEAVHIFSTLGVEPWGRVLLGIIELITGLLVLVPQTVLKGLFLSIGLMIGAVLTHLFTDVGIVVKWNDQSDHGELFIMAIIALVLSKLTFYIISQKLHVSCWVLLKEVITLKR